MKSISRFNVEGVDVTKEILGCDSFVYWLYSARANQLGRTVWKKKGFEDMTIFTKRKIA